MLSYSRHLLKMHLNRNLKNPTNKFLSSSQNYQEVRIPVPWGHIAGKWWGPTDRRPILTVHGWQDNCGSFNRLIPLLLNDNVGFLAVDLPGHGYSSRLPSGMFYYYTNYLLAIHYVVTYFKWPKISFMGHSLGGLISSVYSMLFPKYVDFLICIDGVYPAYDDYFSKMAQDLTKFPRLAQFEMSNEEPPSYTMGEIKEKICTPIFNSIEYEDCYHVIERNVAPSKIHPGKYFFTRDVRLKLDDSMNWPKEVTLEFAKNVTFPIFHLKATRDDFQEKENFANLMKCFKETSVDYEHHYVNGSHHIHLNNPERIADLINKFIKKHDVAGRDEGGMKEEMRWLKANL